MVKFYQLAMAYFPNIKRTSSVARMRRWIQSDPMLLKALRKAGYRKGQHVLTLRQVGIFKNIWGPPLPLK